jgi:hypothetical protein
MYIRAIRAAAELSPSDAETAVNTIHNKLQAFLKLLEFRIIGSACGGALTV